MLVVWPSLGVAEDSDCIVMTSQPYRRPDDTYDGTFYAFFSWIRIFERIQILPVLAYNHNNKVQSHLPKYRTFKTILFHCLLKGADSMEFLRMALKCMFQCQRHPIKD